MTITQVENVAKLALDGPHEQLASTRIEQRRGGTLILTDRSLLRGVINN